MIAPVNEFAIDLVDVAGTSATIHLHATNKRSLLVQLEIELAFEFRTLQDYRWLDENHLAALVVPTTQL